MAKFLVVLALTSVAYAIDQPGLGPIGYPIGGVSKQYTSVGHSVGGYPIGGIGIGGVGVSKQISTVGVGGYPIGIGGVGVSKQISSVGHYGGIGGVGVSKQISSVGHYGGIGIGGMGPYGGIGHHGIGHGISHGIHHGIHHGIGHHGIGGVSSLSVNRLSVPAMGTIPGGYYGGILAYPQAIPSAVTTSSLHFPGAAVDTYKGYYAGYYPGSFGYGNSYRFFH